MYQKCLPYYILNNPIKTESVLIISGVPYPEKFFTSENYKLAHLTWIMSLHYLVKCKSSFVL